MKLRFLCDIHWRYALIRSIPPALAGDGRLYGQGDGTVTGRLSGHAQWSNFPRLREHLALPDGRGVIDLEAAGFVLFTLTGLSHLDEGRGIHTMTFHTSDVEYSWLNELVAVGEGTVDVEAGTLTMRYYECVAEPVGVPGNRVVTPEGDAPG